MVYFRWFYFRLSDFGFFGVTCLSFFNFYTFFYILVTYLTGFFGLGFTLTTFI